METSKKSIYECYHDCMYDIILWIKEKLDENGGYADIDRPELEKLLNNRLNDIGLDFGEYTLQKIIMVMLFEDSIMAKLSKNDKKQLYALSYKDPESDNLTPKLKKYIKFLKRTEFTKHMNKHIYMYKPSISKQNAPH